MDLAVTLTSYHRNDFITGNSLRTRLLEALHLPILLALILAIIGGTRISSSDVSKHGSGESFEKAGAIIFLISFIAICAFDILTMMESRNLPSGAPRNIVEGNATVQLCMAIIEDFVVTFFFLVAGFVAPALNSLANGPGGLAMNTYDGRKGVA